MLGPGVEYIRGTLFLKTPERSFCSSLVPSNHLLSVFCASELKEGEAISCSDGKASPTPLPHVAMTTKTSANRGKMAVGLLV